MSNDPYGLTTQGVGFDDEFLQYLNLILDGEKNTLTLIPEIYIRDYLSTENNDLVLTLSGGKITYLFSPSGILIGRSKGTGLYINSGDVSIDRDWEEVSDVFSSGYKESLPLLSQSLGVQDLTNIQPHEYGVLKLKLGLDKEHLFFPKPFTPSPTQKTPLYFRKEGV